jgi:hypothetical protein
MQQSAARSEMLLWPRTFAELIYKPCEFQQIRHAEERAMLAYNDLRGVRDEIRPLLRNRAYGPLIDLQQQTPSVGVAPLAHASKLFATQWMKRVRDADLHSGLS